MHESVLILGGGLSGLACARYLNDAGVPCTILEASARLGGRCGSDVSKGFILDRGFQVVLDSYPEAKAILNLPSLDLRPFTPGALVFFNSKLHRFVDPFRRPASAIGTALSSLATFGDKLLTARLRRELFSTTDPGQNVRTIDRLREFGFSNTIIDRFFKPFYGGVFLERDLVTSSRMFDFTFRMFARGNATLPAKGMQVIVDQLAGSLTATTIRLNATVSAIEGNVVVLESGERVAGRAIVVATDVDRAALLLNEPLGRQAKWVGTTSVYFSAPRSPTREPILVLDGEGAGPINHVAVVSDASAAYAPPGASLISCTAIGVGHADLAARAIDQLTRWFGQSVASWKHIQTIEIPHALPDQSTAAYETVHRPTRLRPGLYLAGDHRDTASINGALGSGRRVAEAVLADL